MTDSASIFSVGLNGFLAGNFECVRLVLESNGLLFEFDFVAGEIKYVAIFTRCCFAGPDLQLDN